MNCIFNSTLTYKDGNNIKNILQLNSKEIQEINLVCKKYPMLINDYYISLIDPNNPNDPIRKMSIPSILELDDNGNVDTSGEKENTVSLGIQHKYKQTLLILSTNECYMYCRHCFRKRMVGVSNTEVILQLKKAVNYIKENPVINNVLITGGDAFHISNDVIKQYLDQFTKLSQIDFVRFGTRVPVVFPNRIIKDNNLLEILEYYNKKKQIYIITQFNHPKEVTSQAILAIKALKLKGIVIKNQTVLLKGINDSPDVINDLLSKLTTYGIIPYYIFQCRPVRGVLNHFQVPLKEGYQIIDKARALQNGQGKCIRYVLSHNTGKIEIIGEIDGKMIFKYHQAKNPKDNNKIFIQSIDSNQCWI